MAYEGSCIASPCVTSAFACTLLLPPERSESSPKELLNFAP